MGGPDCFEAALAEELVKLHRRLLVEHRRYSATLQSKASAPEHRRRSDEEPQQPGPADGPQTPAGQPAVLEEEELPEEPAKPEGSEPPPIHTRGAWSAESSHALQDVLGVPELEESEKVALGVQEQGESEKAGVDRLVERLESLGDSNSEPDLGAVEDAGDASEPPRQPERAPVSELPTICEKVKNCPVRAAAAAAALSDRQSKASTHSVATDAQRSLPMDSPRAQGAETQRMLRRKISFTTRPSTEQGEGETQQTPRGRWRRRDSVGNFGGASSAREDNRKPSVAHLTDQLIHELRSEGRRPSITSLRSSDMHSTPRQSHGFDLLPVWKRSVLANARSRITCVGTLVRRNSTVAALTDAQESGGVTVGSDALLSRAIMPPSFLPRLGWDFAAMLLIIYDCLVIPLMVFEAELAFALPMIWITRLFWTVNIPISALTGYLKKDGTVEMRPEKVLLNYARSWLVPDLVVVSIDWAEVAVQTGGVGWSRFGNVLRLLRIVRVVRIVRFIKAPEMMDFFNEYIRSEQVLLIVSLSKVILLTLSVAHVIACLWYGVGRISSSDDRRWVKMSNTEGMGFGQQYLVSFHWSLAQFAGELIIEPQNDTERMFVVVVCFLAIIGSSMFVSSLTTSMTRLQILSSQQSSQLATLRRFLLDRNISRPLATRVQQNAQYAMMEQKKDIPEASVDLLALISNPLLVELHFEIYSHVLLEHPFFKCYSHINPGGVQKVCHQAVRLFTMYKGDLLFSDFEVPSSKRMYFIVNGNLQYSQPRHLGITAGKGSWLCEAFLWTHWSHCGTARAGQTSRLLALDADKFQSIISTFPTSHARHYAELFVEAMNEYLIDELTDLETLMDALDDLIEEAFPIEEEDDVDVNNSDGRSSSQDSLRSFGEPNDGTGSQPSAQERRGSFSRESSARRSGDLGGKGKCNKLQTPSGVGGRRLSGSARHSRASQVAKKLSRLSRKSSMTETKSGFLDGASWGALLDRWWHRCCSCHCYRLHDCAGFVRERFATLRARRRASDEPPGGTRVEPFQGAMP